MGFSDSLLESARPGTLRSLPRVQGERFFPSPADWRDEVLYFLLPDRFSDGGEATRPLLDRNNRAAARPAPAGAAGWRWDRWAESGSGRWQGGTLRGIQSKLDYLQGLGISTIWIGPVFKQRAHLDTYHGYGIQDFLDVDPRFGTRADLVSLVKAAHERGMRILLDVIFNHSGSNFDYLVDGQRKREPPFRPWPGFYESIGWRGADDGISDAIGGSDDGVWPSELQHVECYTRAGSGSLGDGSIDDPHATHKRTDFLDLRDFNFDGPGNTLGLLAQCYKYWIALTDCDGFRIDTLKHVSLEQARNFCGSIKEFAARLGKHDFFLVGEVAGGDYGQDRYLDVLGTNLNAALDIGEMRGTLSGVAKGLQDPADFFTGFDAGRAVMGSHRNLGKHHVSILDDHDHVFGSKTRFSSDAAGERQIAAATALQLFTLGIPCIYYGSEQALAGPEPSERGFLPGWGSSDRYLREALFGPAHPRKSGRAGLTEVDGNEPGFGPFGTSGHHCFDAGFSVYRFMAEMIRVRKRYASLRLGRQYPRATSFLGRPFGFHGAGELMAWSRILDDEEALCVVNTHGGAARGADIVVDAALSPPGSEMTAVLGGAGKQIKVERGNGGEAFVALRDVPASGVVVLLNHP